MHTLNMHGDLVRCGVATPGNDHRLGAQEAPPAIISLYTGAGLEKHIKAVAAGGKLSGYNCDDKKTISFGSNAVLPIRANVEDRNRTAPFPFIGNRFEFRAVGSNQNIMLPLALLQSAYADGLQHIADLVEKKGMNIQQATAKTINDSMRIIFNGNGYSKEWQEEAKKRGLPNLRNTPDAIATFNSAKNVDLFARHGIMNANVVEARQNVLFENYANTIMLEAKTMLNMLQGGVLPACARDLSSTNGAKLPANLSAFAASKTAAYEALAAETARLDKAINSASGDTPQAEAFAARDVLGQMETTRAVADKVERLVPTDLWPYPKYEELFYEHHSESTRNA